MTDLQKEIIADLCCMYGFEPKFFIEATKSPLKFAENRTHKKYRRIKNQVERLANE